MRLMFDCWMASTLPTNIESAARTAKMVDQSAERRSLPRASKKTRIRTAKAAAFEATERKAAMAVGAPV